MCRIKVKIKGKNAVVNTLGYRGAREAHTPLGDARQARMFVVPKSEARKLGLKTGTNVVVKVGRAKIRGTVKRWSRGSKIIVPSQQYPLKRVSTSTLRRVLVD